MFNKLVLIMCVAGSVLLARSGESRAKITESFSQPNNNYYFDNNLSEDSGIKVDRRKRSHKRRRKIRKPIKGLR